LDGRLFRCPECGFNYYHNVAAATGCFIDNGRGILFLMRSKEPQKGKLDVPGGFVDPGEGLLAGLQRECKEEIGLEIKIERLQLLASFPNKYPYKGIEYNTCDVFFALKMEGLTEKMLKIEKEELSKANFIDYKDINIEDLAFASTKKALQTLIERGFY